MKKKYFIYVDILGFEKLPEEIAEKTGIEGDIIREKFFTTPLEETIRKIEHTRIEASRGKSEIEKGSDNFVLMVDTPNAVFETIGKIIAIKIPCEGYQYIPLEVVVGGDKIDENTKVELKNRKEIIHFLKNNIISPYRKYYKNKYGHSVEETFVIFTEDFLCDLEPLDRKCCKKIMCEGKTFFLVSTARILERCSMLDFSKKIEYPNSQTYGRIDEVYVPPVEYEDIQNTLREKKIVFITGTQEFGKTYTAVRLMWEYYNRGYEPRWVRGGEEVERVALRTRLEDIGAELEPRQVIYFEDPFGKTRYEKRELLEREIGTIINIIIRTRDVYVIITSREEVFKEFEKDKLSAQDIKQFEEKLNLKRPSYDYKRRRKILENWAEYADCKWLKEGNLKELVVTSIADQKTLPTPLSIRDFTIATVDADKRSELEKAMKEKSEETGMAFSKEIREMRKDKMLFLSLLFISDSFQVSFLEETYEEFVKELDLTDPWKFDRILDWFKDDKISISGCVRLSHPSYYEALKYLLAEDGHPTWISERIFSRLILRFLNCNETVWAAVLFLVKNFDSLPENLRILIKVFFETASSIKDVSLFMAENFDSLPKDTRNELLLVLSKKYEVPKELVWILAENFNDISEGVRNELLMELSENDEIAGDIAWILAENFNDISEGVRNELLIKLSGNDESPDVIAWIVTENFSKFSEDIRSSLVGFFEKDADTIHLAQAVLENFRNLPESLRIRLLSKCSENDMAAYPVALTVVENFDVLPENIRNLLFRFSGKKTTARDVARAISESSESLPEYVRNELLLVLSTQSEAARYVTWTIIENFDVLPENVKNLLKQLQDSLQRIMEDLALSLDPKNREKVLLLISKAKSMVNPDFLSMILEDLTKQGNKGVRMKARKMLETIHGE